MDVINFEKFYRNRFRGLDFVGGRILAIPIGMRCRKLTLPERTFSCEIKRNEVQPGEVSVRPTLVQKTMSSGGSQKAEVIGGASLTAGERLFQACTAATGNARSPSIW